MSGFRTYLNVQALMRGASGTEQVVTTFSWTRFTSKPIQQAIHAPERHTVAAHISAQLVIGPQVRVSSD